VHLLACSIDFTENSSFLVPPRDWRCSLEQLTLENWEGLFGFPALNSQFLELGTVSSLAQRERVLLPLLVHCETRRRANVSRLEP
jgi:hypothetical protein